MHLEQLDDQICGRHSSIVRTLFLFDILTFRLQKEVVYGILHLLNDVIIYAYIFSYNGLFQTKRPTKRGFTMAVKENPHADAILGLDDVRVVQPFSPTNDIDPTPIYLSQFAMDRYYTTALFKNVSPIWLDEARMFHGFPQAQNMQFQNLEEGNLICSSWIAYTGRVLTMCTCVGT
ncbi:hypothetical protein ACJX0J_008057, partial [Zea mays]